jgi:alpha-methylacyl-CoA racemase
MAGIGPAPFCCMLLADMGADVIRVERTGAAAAIPRHQFLQRGRRSIALDLKHPRGVEVVQRLLTDCDALVEGFRPGVMERLGLGPDECLASNPRLVSGRMTGWGQDGPLAQLAGHDINFISVTGSLHAIGPAGGLPVPPLNLVADFGGGALYLALGIVSALYETRGSGAGQVVDASMVDGTASLMTSLFGAMARGEWRNQRGANLLDGGAPWYSVYETRDGKLVSIGAIEPQFYGDPARPLGPEPVACATSGSGRHVQVEDARRMVRAPRARGHLLHAGPGCP